MEISRFPAATSNPNGAENACRAISTIQSSVIMTLPVWDNLPSTNLFFGEILMVDGGTSSSRTWVRDNSTWHKLAYAEDIAGVTQSILTGATLVGSIMTINSMVVTVLATGATSSAALTLPTGTGSSSGSLGLIYDSTYASYTGDALILAGGYSGWGNSTFNIVATQITIGTVVEIDAAGFWTLETGHAADQYVTLDANNGSGCTMYFALQGTSASHQEFTTHITITFNSSVQGSAFAKHTINVGPLFGFDPALSGFGYPNTATNIAAERGFSFNTGTSNKWEMGIIGSGPGTVTLTSLVVKMGQYP